MKPLPGYAIAAVVDIGLAHVMDRKNVRPVFAVSDYAANLIPQRLGRTLGRRPRPDWLFVKGEGPLVAVQGVDRSNARQLIDHCLLQYQGWACRPPEAQVKSACRKV